MAKIFITGIAGFLGSHLADAMLADGHEVVGIDSLIGGDIENVPKGTVFRPWNCNNIFVHNKNDLDALLKDVEVVYHCAATAYEGLSVFSPHLITENIVSASVGVFSAAIAAKVKRIVHCSSMARYGDIIPPFEEHDRPRPIDPYGIGKLCAEQILENLCKVHGTEYVIAVPHNIIGPRQKYDDPYRNVASIMINLMLQDRNPIIYGDGEQLRCFSYIDDCLFCLKKLAFDPKVVGHVINIGPDEGAVSINNLVDEISMIIHGCRIIPQTCDPRPQEVKIALCSSDKARKMLGYETKTSLREGLTKMVEFIRERGPKPFVYHLPIEIENERTPKTWKERLF